MVELEEFSKEDLIEAIKTKYNLIDGYKIDDFFSSLD
jgi:hypothetical protein